MYYRLTQGRFDPARYDKIMPVVPDVIAALRGLPGVETVQIGIDRVTGKTIALTRFETKEHAQFSRDDLGPSYQRLLDLGWQGEAPAFYEATD